METLVAVLQVALGLGFVIFVHELGHFAVAKMCGVRCDKFFVGFDVGGIKLSRKWGETEYGIGVLPLGGYVKMYGQEDNAAAIADEIASSKAREGDPDAKLITAPDGSTVWIDKRSYLAKSVPQRMAIISAGVIMNVIFAFFMAWVAFGFGVPVVTSTVGATVAGGPAWKAGLKEGDRFVRINDVEDPAFEALTKAVILGDLEAGVACEVERANGDTETLTIRPEMAELAPRVGVTNSYRLVLDKKEPFRPNTPAAAAGENGFAAGDQIDSIGGESVATYAQMLAVLEAKKSEPLSFTVTRGGATAYDDPFGPVSGGESVTFEIGPNPMERLGVVPTLGPVVAVAQGSPAEAAGVKEGDQLVAVDGVAIGVAADGEPTIDPVLINDRLLSAAQRGEAVTLSLRRGEETLDLSVEPSATPARTLPDRNTPLAYNAIGVACELQAIVAAVVAGSPAAAAELRPGDRIVQAEFVSDNEADQVRSEPIQLGEGHRSWPAILFGIQDRSSDFKVRLQVARATAPVDSEAANEEPSSPTRTVEITPESVDDAFTVTRGEMLQPLKRLRIANSLGERTALAWEATSDNLMSVVRFLSKIGGQVSVKALGGPITIAREAGRAAFEGVGALLMSLVMLSANLAVLNFLPIPVLDGGHMVFLAYEGITGRPVTEKVIIVLQTVGLFFLLGLMLFVTSMDIGRLFGL